MSEPAANNPAGGDFSTPLGASPSGRLEFVRGAANVVLRADSSMGDLYRARFDGPQPEVHARDGTVTIWYPRTFHPCDWRKRTAAVTPVRLGVPGSVGFAGGNPDLGLLLSSGSKGDVPAFANGPE
jgi:hypothetical protein